MKYFTFYPDNDSLIVAKYSININKYIYTIIKSYTSK